MSAVTIRNFENEKSAPQRASLDVIRRALEAAGVEFIPENGGGAGVRLGKYIVDLTIDEQDISDFEQWLKDHGSSVYNHEKGRLVDPDGKPREFTSKLTFASSIDAIECKMKWE